MRIGDYEVLDELARGGMGAVYRARRLTGGGEVAIKLLLAGGEGPARKRFQREAEALAQLQHPGIVPVHDLGEHEGRAYLVLGLVEGESLEQRLAREGALPVWEAVELVRDVALALEHAHQRGLLHRDVKPGNVLLDRVAGRPLLTGLPPLASLACHQLNRFASAPARRLASAPAPDFGLVKDLDPALSQSRLSVEGRYLGTPGYWAPEQARGQLARLGPWTDVYGLGALLYALLVGEPPHVADGIVGYLDALDRPVIPPSQRRPGLDPGLDAICLRCLAHEPEQRYPSAGELARALDAWLERGGPGRWRRWAAAALLLAALAGGAGTLAWRRARWNAYRARLGDLLEYDPPPTAAGLAEARARLEAARALADGDGLVDGPLRVREHELATWEELLAAGAVEDLNLRALRLRSLRRAAGGGLDGAQSAALDEAVVGALVRLGLDGPRSCLDVPGLEASRGALRAVEALHDALDPQGPASARRLAARSLVRARVDLLVARSRGATERFDPLLGELEALLANLPASCADLAPFVRLELGLMHARGARFARSLQVLVPLAAAPGPEGRVAAAEAITIGACCANQVDVGALIRRVLGEQTDDLWRQMARQRQGIRARDQRLQQDAERQLIERYRETWAGPLNEGDRLLAQRKVEAALAAYARAERSSPRDARIWFWRAASLASAKRFAGLGVFPQPALARLEDQLERDRDALQEAGPPGGPRPAPDWNNVR
ncbi:MAG: protein kinase [Planctomycetota bacterium]